MGSSIDSAATASDANSETLDFLSHAWCSFAVQAFQPPDLQHHQARVPQDKSLINNPMFQKLENDNGHNFPPKLGNSVRMDDPDVQWKSNDLKSWIWMQQAMHPELNYNSCFHRKWMPWNKIPPIRINVSIKKWLKEIKQRKKEEGRLQRAQVHAAVSVAGVAAALAAVAAENSKVHDSGSNTATKDSAVASAAALVAAQCAQMAEAMGAKREQLSAVMDSAMTGTSASDILTLTAAATSSIRGAATLRARSGCNINKSRINGGAPVLPIDQDSSYDDEFDHHSDFENCRAVLANGSNLTIQTWEGKCEVRTVSIILNNEAKVILLTRKPNLLKSFTSKQESIIIDLHAELYKGGATEQPNNRNTSTCYLLVLTTNKGITKLDMKDDYQRHKMWATTINRLLMLSTSFSRYELQFYEN